MKDALILLDSCVERFGPDWRAPFIECLELLSAASPSDGSTSLTAGRPTAQPSDRATPVASTWLLPLALAVRTILDTATSRANPQLISAQIANMPSLYDHMDHDALARVLEHGMAGAAADSATWVLVRADGDERARHAVPLSANSARDLLTLALSLLDPTFGPWEEAAQKLADKTPVAAELTSAAWADVPAALRQRAMLSARVASIDLLAQMQDDLTGALAATVDERGRGFDRENFVSRSRALALDLGVQTIGDDPEKLGTLRDIRSTPRLRLIYDTNVRQAQEWTRARADLSAGALDAYPAYIFRRVESREIPRPETFWSARWAQAFAEVGGEGARESPKAALKTSPIWQALGDLGPFGTSYEPYEWGSGMGRVDLSRREAEAVGLIAPGAELSPEPIPGFNDSLALDLPAADPALVEKLRASFGDQIAIADGKVTWQG